MLEIGETIKFKDTSGISYCGLVIDIRDGIASAAVLGYSDLFRFRVEPEAHLFYDRTAGTGTIREH